MATGSARVIEVLSPAGVRRAREIPLAERPLNLDGKVLGLLDNGKFNSGALAAGVGEALAGRYQLKSIFRYSKSATPHGAAGPLPEAARKELVERCDLVLNAVGD